MCFYWYCVWLSAPIPFSPSSLRPDFVILLQRSVPLLLLPVCLSSPWLGALLLLPVCLSSSTLAALLPVCLSMGVRGSRPGIRREEKKAALSVAFRNRVDQQRREYPCRMKAIPIPSSLLYLSKANLYTAFPTCTAVVVAVCVRVCVCVLS